MMNRRDDVTISDSVRLEAALKDLETWPDERLVGQLFSLAIGHHSTRGIATGADDSQNSTASSIIALIESHHLGGVCYFPTALAGDSPQDIADLIAAAQGAAQIPLLVSTDQENGTVARLKQGFTRLPSAMALAAAATPELWLEAGRISAMELAAVGINHAFAPVADMNSEPRNPVIGIRSAGAHINAVTAQITQVIAGMKHYPVASTLKHFPGHGSTTVDSHLGLPHLTLSRSQWVHQEREAFKQGIAAGADSIMIGHLVFDAIDPEAPATFSRKVVTGELRDSLGFDGVIVTDALEMSGARHGGGPGAACVAALNAGVDQVLMPGNPEEAIAHTVLALKEGDLDREALIASARRIIALKLKLARMSDAMESPTKEDLASPEHVRIAQEMADRSMLWRDPQTTWSTAALATGDSVLVVGPPEDPIGRGINVAKSLQDDFANQGLSVVHREFGAEDLAAVAMQSKTVVIVARDAWRDPVQGSSLAELLELTHGTETGLCVIASRNPSDSGVVPAHVPLLLMFGDLAPATDAVIRILNGQLKPSGILPVDLLDQDGNVGWAAPVREASN